MNLEPPSSPLPPGLCAICKKLFDNRKLKNRHLKRVHNIAVSLSRNSMIVCALCPLKERYASLGDLRKHHKENHGIDNPKLEIEFLSDKDFQAWKDEEKIETMYAIERRNEYKSYTDIHYACNRSKIRRYQPKHEQRTEKAGGSIRIDGVCPSKLQTKIYKTGKVIVVFWKIHVGHDEDLRTKHLSRREKKEIVAKLEAGVQQSRILDDARKIYNSETQRLHLLNNNDINYLSKKFNIQKKRDEVWYDITSKKICENACRTLYCRVCKICIPRYHCTCPEYQVKNTLCKHLVQMYELNTDNQISDDFAEALGENSLIKTQQHDEISHFISDKKIQHGTTDSEAVQIKREEFNTWVTNLDNQTFNFFFESIQGVISKINGNPKTTSKRKMEKQTASAEQKGTKRQKQNCAGEQKY